MAGRCIWQGGRWRLQAGAYRIPEVTLDAHDLREGALQLTTRLSRASIYNLFNSERNLTSRPNLKLNRADALAE